MTTIKYAMDQNIFGSKEVFKEAIQAVKEKQITVNELKKAIDFSILALYNDLVGRFFGSETVNSQNIYKRDSLESIINNPENSYSIQYFQVLKDNGFIGVCGRGYTFEYPKFDNEHLYSSYIEVVFQKQVTI